MINEKKKNMELPFYPNNGHVACIFKMYCLTCLKHCTIYKCNIPEEINFDADLNGKYEVNILFGGNCKYSVWIIVLSVDFNIGTLLAKLDEIYLE